MTKPAEQTSETETETERVIPVVPLVHEKCVWLNKAGTRFAQWEAVAPEGVTFDDLLDPALWKRVQETKRPAIRQGDELRIVAFDKSWVVWCYVSHASANGILLARFADAKPQGPREHLAEDDKYRVIFSGSGYAVQRKSDNQEMVAPVHSAAAAETNLRNLYPTRVA